LPLVLFCKRNSALAAMRKALYAEIASPTPRLEPALAVYFDTSNFAAAAAFILRQARRNA